PVEERCALSSCAPHFLKLDYLTTLVDPTLPHCLGDPSRNRFRRAPQWIVVEVGVSGRRRGLLMAQQLADNWQPKAAGSAKRCVGVSEVVKADTFQPRTLSHCCPWSFQVRAGILILVSGITSGDDVNTDTRKFGENRRRGRVEDNGLATSLAVREKQQPALKINICPPQSQDFAQAATGEQ